MRGLDDIIQKIKSVVTLIKLYVFQLKIIKNCSSE